MPMNRRKSNQHERGFTLAAVLVMLSVLMIFAAYTVPQMWSDILRRERDYQTVFAMKQYARAITEYTKQRKVPPTTLDDLEKQMKPRVLRKLYPNPLSGEVDWILVTAEHCPISRHPRLPPV
jgi:type II secretory pathway pseudopilin PulG